MFVCLFVCLFAWVLLDRYTAVTLFNICRFPLAVMPLAVRFVAEALVGIKRVNQFLNTAVTRDTTHLQNRPRATSKLGDGLDGDGKPAFAIDIQNVDCQWQHNEDDGEDEGEGDDDDKVSLCGRTEPVRAPMPVPVLVPVLVLVLVSVICLWADIYCFLLWYQTHKRGLLFMCSVPGQG